MAQRGKKMTAASRRSHEMADDRTKRQSPGQKQQAKAPQTPTDPTSSISTQEKQKNDERNTKALQNGMLHKVFESVTNIHPYLKH